jgi:hypothetical protein
VFFVMFGMGIIERLEDFEKDLVGKGNILFHKRIHKSGRGEFACLRGILEGCPEVVNCKQLYHLHEGSYCLHDGQAVGGLLAEEDKHEKLVQRGAPGAYPSIKEALAGID